jgi:hypothetical protein
MMGDRRTKAVHQIAGTDPADAEAYRTIAQALRQVADGPIDTGAAMGAGADFWVTIAGIEYLLTATRSRKQRILDGTEMFKSWDEATNEDKEVGSGSIHERPF